MGCMIEGNRDPTSEPVAYVRDARDSGLQDDAKQHTSQNRNSGGSSTKLITCCETLRNN